jgi:hypothetical protein
MASLEKLWARWLPLEFAQAYAELSAEIVASRFVLAKQIVGVVPLSAGIASR